jgi:hypothetical protein
MPFLRQSRDWAACERCRRRFNLIEGGVCRSCGRILCDDHLYGSWIQRLRRYVGAAATCVECRAAPSAG